MTYATTAYDGTDAYSRDEFVRSLQALVSATLDPLVKNARFVALLDFPDHGNVGDSAIWLGETAYLRKVLGKSPDYVCTAMTYSAAALREAAPAGPIMLSGGGNFGDLYLLHQELREQICRDFPDRPVVQLPQTIHFESSERFDQARRVIGAHDDFTLCARDETSLELAQSIDCKSALAPDMAFWIGAIESPRTHRSHDIVGLLRRDKEALNRTILQEGLSACSRIEDWFIDDRPVLHVLEDYVAERRSLACGYEQVAAHRLARGIEILTSGRRIVTDRLHGHILSVLLGRPHFVLDNSYGKNRAFLETWSRRLHWVAHGQTPEAFNDWLMSTSRP